LRTLTLGFENFLDVTDSKLFGSSLREIKIETLSCEKFASNKLFFDICTQESNIQKLKLKACIFDENIQKIGVLGKKNKSLQVLNLSHNNLTDNIAQTLAQFLKD